ncbi:MAG: hypothetical protein ABIG34_04395 [Candidatus Peregrinibacteria bacterium]
MPEAQDDPPVRILHAGTVALDAISDGQDLADDPLCGTVGWVTPQGRVLSGEDDIGEFTEPDLNRVDRIKAGGIANALGALALIGANESLQQQAGATIDSTRQQARRTIMGIMARMGDDKAEKRYRSLIHPDVDQGLISVVQGGKTGLSHVRLQGKTDGDIEEGTYAIRFRPGASGEWVPTEEELKQIRQLHPDCLNISYPGLFPYGMDKSNGADLSRFIGETQQFCPMVGYDTHGPTELCHVEPSLSHTDTFNANYANAARIFLSGEVEAVDLDDRDGTLQRIEEQIRGYMVTPTGRSRLFTITHRNGTLVVFQSASGQVQSRHCLSPCAQIPAAVGTVGAGDVQNGTTQLYLAREMGDKWKDGSVTLDDVSLAAKIGQISTTLHLQGEGGKAYVGVTMAKMEALARTGRKFKTIEELQEALMAIAA